MNIFKKLDNYLLHNLPSMWVTRVHYFLPIGLALVLLIYLVNVSIGWNPKETLPSVELPILLMTVPVLVYLVYWFIFQSRYNVEKSGGKMTYIENYLNFFLYILVFSVAYSFILVIPFSNDQKLTNAVGLEEVKKDIENLNRGNSLVNYDGSIVDEGNGTYTVWDSDFIYDYYSDYMLEGDYDAQQNGELITRREALERIERYVESYNKYVRSEIHESPAEILDERLSDDYQYDDYYYYDYYDSEWAVSNKISRIRDLHASQGYSMWSEPWFWRVSFAFIAWLALLVWIFKRMNLRHFIFGFISICLTPLLAAIVGGVLFGLIYGYYAAEDTAMNVALNIVFAAYIIVAVLFIRGYMQDRLNQTSYVLSMYFHFWIPLLPAFIYAMVLVNREYEDYYYGYYYDYVEPKIAGMKEEEFVYMACVILGLVSIAVFKPIYAKFRSLPMRK